MRHRFETTKDKCMAAHKITTVVPHVLQNIKPSIKHRRYIPASWTGHFWLPSRHVCSLSLSPSLSPSLQTFSVASSTTERLHILQPYERSHGCLHSTYRRTGKSAALSPALSHTHMGMSFTSGGGVLFRKFSTVLTFNSGYEQSCTIQ